MEIRISAIASQVNVFRQIEIDLDDVEWLPGDGIIRRLRVASGEGEEGKYDERVSHVAFGYWLLASVCGLKTYLQFHRAPRSHLSNLFTFQPFRPFNHYTHRT